MFNLFRLCRKDEGTKFRSTLLPKTATVSKQHVTLSKGLNFTINLFDIVAVFGNKVECRFDKVAGVDGALDSARITWSQMGLSIR